MDHDHLTQEQVRDVLARAEEIQRRMAPDGEPRTDRDTVLRAAEEAGLSRASVEQALQEVMPAATRPPKIGDVVFAKSADGHYYCAEVTLLDGHEVNVRFLNGGEHFARLDHLRPASFLPGEKITVPLPFWGWWPCKVVSYDAEEREVTVSDDWNTLTFELSQVRLDPPKQQKSMRSQIATKAYLWGVASGGLVTALITWWLMR